MAENVCELGLNGKTAAFLTVFLVDAAVYFCGIHPPSAQVAYSTRYQITWVGYWRSLEHLKSFTQVTLHYARTLNTSFWVHPGPPAAGGCGGGSARQDQCPMSPCGNNCLWNSTTIHALYTGSRFPRM